MGFLNFGKKIIGKMLNNTSTKNTTQNVESENEILENVQTIDEFFLENEQDIFENVIFDNLFNDFNKYSDDGIFVKADPYLKDYFEKSGYDWEQNKTQIISLCRKSDKLKVIGNFLQGNFKYYITYPLNLDFVGHFSDWLKFIIDKSIEEKRPLTKQYARMVVGNYYYKRYNANAKKSALYKNLIQMISAEEFKIWIKNDEKCFENLCQLVEKRFKKIGVQDIDERVLIKEIIKSKLFKKALEEYEFIDKNARVSKYSSIYISTLGDDSIEQIDLSIRNVNIENAVIKKQAEVKTESATSKIETLKQEPILDEKVKEPSKKVETLKQECKEVPKQEEALSIKNKDIIKNSSKGVKKEDNSKSDEVDFDYFIKKIAGQKRKAKTAEEKFFESIKDELIAIDEAEDFNFKDIVPSSDDQFDEEIDNLRYI